MESLEENGKLLEGYLKAKLELDKEHIEELRKNNEQQMNILGDLRDVSRDMKTLLDTNGKEIKAGCSSLSEHNSSVEKSHTRIEGALNKHLNTLVYLVIILIVGLFGTIGVNVMGLI